MKQKRDLGGSLQTKLCCAFTGGGTGGHIYPGLAVVDALKERFDCTVVWIGSSSGMDKTLVQKSGSVDFFEGVPSGKLRRYFSLQNVKDFFKIIAGFFKSYAVLKKYAPAFLFSKGGFVSVPPCFAAKLLGIPVFTHECDYSPGLATRLNAKVASKIFLSYEETANFFADNLKQKTLVTGNPVRPAFYTADAVRGHAYINSVLFDNFGTDCNTDNLTKPMLLVLGGSGGAKQINELVWRNIDWLCERFFVVHQTGASQQVEDALKDSAVQKNASNKAYLAVPFIYNEMSDVIASSDVIFSRSGANTLWEGAVLAKPFVLLPLCGSGTRGDQVENANYFAKKNAVIVLDQSQQKGAQVNCGASSNCGAQANNATQSNIATQSIDEQLKSALQKLCNKDERKILCQNAKALTGTARPADVIARFLSQLLADEVKRRI